MTASTVMGLINNTALLLALGLLYDTLPFEHRGKKLSVSQFLTGAFIGLLGIALMMTPWEFLPGLVFDTRSVLLCVSGVFFGAIPTALAVIVTAAFRLYSGGIGMWTGVAVIASSGGMGLAWRYFRRKDSGDVSIGELYLLGILVHVTMLLWMFLMPRQTALAAISHIGVPVMLIFPLATALLGRLISARYARKKVANTLRESQQELADIFSMSLDMICIADINTATFLKVNPAFTRILGYLDQELLNRSFLDFIHPDDVEPTLTMINEKLKKGEKVIDFTNRYRCRDGNYRWLDWVSQPMPERGVTFAVGHDITARKRSEDLLRERESFIKSVMDNLPIGIAVNSVDPAVKFEYINDNFIKYYRTTHEALADPNAFWAAVYEDPEFMAEIKKRILDDCASGDPKRLIWEDVPITRKGEETTFINARNIPIPEKQLMISTVWDVTDRKLTEDALKDSERLLNEVGKIANIGGWEMDLITRKAKWTKGTYDIVEIEYNQPVPGPDEHIAYYLPEYRSLVSDSMQALVDEDRPFDYEAQFKTAKNNNIWCRAIGLATRKDGRCIKVYGTFQDITDRKKAEEEIRALNRDLELRVQQRTLELQEANRELQDFVYSVSHDLRAPLRSISGFAEIIDRRHKNSLNEEGRHYFENIVKASKQMGELIDDLLKFSRLGRKGIKSENVSLDEVFKSAIETLSDQIKKTDARISLPESMPVIQGDLALATHIFINLLENALKYHKPDAPPLIDVGVEVKDQTVVISVADKGIGIAPEYHEKIFNIFQRLHSQAEYPGTGIGLAAVKKAMQIMGGQVWIESEIDKGSVFKIKALKAMATPFGRAKESMQTANNILYGRTFVNE